MACFLFLSFVLSTRLETRDTRHPSRVSHFLGGEIHAVPEKALEANELATLSNIGDISEDVHAYVLAAGLDLAPEKVLFSGARHHAS